MSLSAKRALRLQDAGLVRLFDQNREVWAVMAGEAYDYTAERVKGAGQPVRPDDLIPVLVPVLEITQLLRTFLAQNRLSQNFWYTWFGELIVDREWSKIAK